VKFLTRLRVAVAVILLAIVIIAFAVYLATPPTPSPTPEVTPTVPAPTPTPHPVPSSSPIRFEFDVNASYGFDKLLSTLYPPHFLISRGKSFTVVMIVTSQSNRTVSISVGADLSQVPGVDVKFDPQTFSLNPKEKIVLKMTLTVSPTAPTSTPEPTPTSTTTPTTPAPTPAPPPVIPENLVQINFYSEGSIVDVTGILLTII